LCLLASSANKKPALGGLDEAQALRSFLIPTRDSSPAMMKSHRNTDKSSLGNAHPPEIFCLKMEGFKLE
jgi:hypothetical protein